MARRGRPKKNPNQKQKSRPLRTREHIIADLSVLHFQWIAANCGYVAEEPDHDYGYDLVLFTYTQSGEIENGAVYFQFKATDVIDKYIMADGQTLSFRIERQHIELWRDEPMPVILVVYDAKGKQAYWLYAQRYFKSADFFMPDDQSHVNLHIPINHTVDAAAVEVFRAFKEDVLRRIREVPLHHEAGDIQSVGESPGDPGI